ncbi:MAG: type II toxin-antitoxin system RelE/ParE family toxin [Ferruginibacter sp.]
MVKIVWTEIAVDDLRNIHDYISKDSERYADRFIEKIINRVTQLENFPKSGCVVPEFNSVVIRELIEGNYRIIYKVSSSQVSIIRIHHAARHLE